MRRKHILSTSIVIAATAAIYLGCGAPDNDDVRLGTPASTRMSEATRTSTKAPKPTATQTSAVTMCARTANSSDTGLFTIVDKERALPSDFEPTDLVAIPDRLAAPGFPGQQMRREAADALVRLLDAAESQGVELRARSTYRSYDEQVVTFQYWVDRLGEAQARRESAEPGHSEHQLGTVGDVVSRSIGWELIIPFGDTAEGKWLNAHAHEYGFAISYPKDGEAVTGYIYEPWHVRYVGVQCSQAWFESQLILVRFLEAVRAAS